MVTIGWSVGWSAGPTVQSFRPDWKHKRWDHIWAEISEVFLSWKACWLRDDCFREILVLAMVVSSVIHDPRGASCCRTTYYSIASLVISGPVARQVNCHEILEHSPVQLVLNYGTLFQCLGPTCDLVLEVSNSYSHGSSVKIWWNTWFPNVSYIFLKKD